MADGAGKVGAIILSVLLGSRLFTPPARFAVDIQRMEQGEQFCLVAPGYFLSPLGFAFEFEQSLTPIFRCAGVDLQEALLQAFCGTALSVLNGKRQEQWQGEDGGEKIEDNGERDANPGRQTFEPGQLALQERARRLAGVEMLQILFGSRCIDQAGAEWIAAGFNRISRA